MNASIGWSQMGLADANDTYNALRFIIQAALAELAIAKLVRVEAVHAGAGDLDPPTVDVLPLVSQVDGNGNQVKHGVIHGVQCLRLQGGAGAIIADPMAGDVGLIVCADRDSSSAIASPGDQVTPGSARMYDFADAIYVGAMLNAAPTSYIRLKADGSLKMADAFGNVLETSAAGFVVTTAPGGDFTVNGISVRLHVHPVTTAPGTTEPPVP